MAIHVLDVLDRVQVLFPLDDAAYETIGAQFQGRAIGPEWCPPRVKIKNPDMSVGRHLIGDCFWLWSSGEVPVVSLKGKVVIEALVHDEVEFLELPVGSQTLFAINAIRQVDCIDHERAETKRFSDGGVMRYTKYAFISDRTASLNLFKAVGDPRGFIFVSNAFVALTQQKLAGFYFKDATFAGSLGGKRIGN